ncbi:glycosyltransferase family 69 protein [Cercophora scortea]|uniref:Glycosyltransferase family 69 protein n=1 Tax=Cercophora scortea TaxID=314031 RepID=A0AAE0M9S4_9PEZI|nr:glycosyltransferase family 69 protein [Cercophora scortea]
MSRRRFGSFAQVCALFLCGLPIVTRLGHLSTVIPQFNYPQVQTFIPPILNPLDTSVNRTICPAINDTRYSHLRPVEPDSGNKRKYVFSVSLQQCIDLLPSVLGPLIEVIRFLGPWNCAISIISRNSTDGTLEVLRLLAAELERLDVGYWLTSTNLDPNAGSDEERIRKLALLRTIALEPITGQHTELNDNNDGHRKPFPNHSRPATTIHRLSSPTPSNISLTPDATLISLTTVAICAEDILELIHQRAHQSADMVCAMDWWFPSPQHDHDHAHFSSLWSSRALNGDLLAKIFFPSSPDYLKEKEAEQQQPDLVLANHPASRARLQANLPFQVFACHSGLAAYAAQPLADHRVGFRGPRDGECFQGETQLFCKDMWRTGFGRIAVVPSVNVGCSSGGHLRVGGGGGDGGRVKRVKGFEGRIVWQEEPPERVVCMPGFGDQTWLAWDEGLG